MAYATAIWAAFDPATDLPERGPGVDRNVGRANARQMSWRRLSDTTRRVKFPLTLRVLAIRFVADASNQRFELDGHRWIVLVAHRRCQRLDDRLIGSELLEMLEGEVKGVARPASVDGEENLGVLALLACRSGEGLRGDAGGWPLG